MKETIYDTVGAIIAILIGVVLSSCTVAPSPVQHKIASVWVQTHVKGYDSTGYIVDLDWVTAYKQMYASYGKKLPVREQTDNISSGIEQNLGGWYHVTFEVNRRFADMIYYEQNEGP